MQYMGGKARIGKRIAEHLNDALDGELDFIEPFVGGFNIVPHINTTGIIACSDINEALVHLYRALQEGWIPPTTLTKEEYEEAKTLPNYNPLKAFAGFGVSFSGKWFGGYASRPERDYAKNCHNSLMKKIEHIKKVSYFDNLPYDQFWNYDMPHCVLYCDPPYAGTTTYSAAQGFDSDAFWAWCLKMAERHFVYVSEYTCPLPHVVCFEKDQKTTVCRDKSKYRTATEKLFLIDAF